MSQKCLKVLRKQCFPVHVHNLYCLGEIDGRGVFMWWRDIVWYSPSLIFHIFVLFMHKFHFLTLSHLSPHFWGKKWAISLENASNLTVLIKKILINFLAEIVIQQTHVSNLMHFQGEMVNFFPQKQGTEKWKSYADRASNWNWI